MGKALKVLIFTDLDGSLLHRDTFKFDEIKNYLKQIISKGEIVTIFAFDRFLIISFGENLFIIKP